jgi:hypothetical protein
MLGNKNRKRIRTKHSSGEAQKRERVPEVLSGRSARAGKVRMPKKAPENLRRP